MDVDGSFCSPWVPLAMVQIRKEWKDFRQIWSLLLLKDGVKLHVQEYGEGAPVMVLAGAPGLNTG